MLEKTFHDGRTVLLSPASPTSRPAAASRAFGLAGLAAGRADGSWQNGTCVAARGHVRKGGLKLVHLGLGEPASAHAESVSWECGSYRLLVCLHKSCMRKSCNGRLFILLEGHTVFNCNDAVSSSRTLNEAC